MRKTKRNIPGIIALALAIWTILSIAEVNFHSLDSGYEYSDFNLFSIVVKVGASPELASHETRKGLSKLPPIKRIDTDKVHQSDVRMCIEWMQTDIGQWACNYAEQNGYNKYVLVSQVFSESRFAPTVTSHSGAVGLMQILPSYAGNYMSNVGASNLFNQQDNIKTGIEIMNYWNTESQGSMRFALAMYNGGYSGKHKSNCLNYADTIIYRALAIQQAVEQN